MQAHRTGLVMALSLFLASCMSHSSAPLPASKAMPTASCGCFVWSGAERFVDDHLLFVDVEADSGKQRVVQLASERIELSTGSEMQSAKRQSLAVGNVIEERFVDRDIAAILTWTATAVRPSPDGYETEWQVVLDVDRFDKSERFTGVGYCGC